MNQVYIVHENIPYEFGRVRGVFLSQEAAIAFAETLTDADELTVSRWIASDDASGQKKEDVWERLYTDRPARIPPRTGCHSRLAPGQHWAFCGETDMGDSEPALCTECGGEFKRAE